MNACSECGASFEEVARARNRKICVLCLRVELRTRKAHRSGLFRRGERQHEAEELKKYYGRALFERRARMAKYAEAVAQNKPIPFEPRFRVR